MKNYLNYKDFQRKTFPYESPFQRTQFGRITNLIKFFALRFSYVFYRLGISANVLDMIGLVLLVPGFVLVLNAITSQELIDFLFGFLIIAFVIFIDFIDGPLSKIDNYIYKVGDNMDNLCPDVVLVGGLVMIGVMTQNIYLITASTINAVFFLTYKSSTIDSIPDEKNWLITLLNSRFSILSVRVFIAGIFPISCVIYISNESIGQFIAIGIVSTNAILSFLWLKATWEDKIIR